MLYELVQPTQSLHILAHELLMQPSCPVSDSSPISSVSYFGVGKLGLFGVFDNRLDGMFYSLCEPC